VAKIVVRLQVAVLTQHDEDRRARIGKDAALDKIEEPLSEVGTADQGCVVRLVAA
jgi:hypothetical protein